MFSKANYINLISLLVILLVNSLFLYKFSVIYTGFPVLITLLYMLGFTVIIYAAGNAKQIPLLNKKILTIKAILVSAAVLAFILLFPRLGEIGRLPAIEDWIDRFRAGLFPYNSPHTPSSYPVIFFLAYPFHLMGNAGVLPFFGTILFMFLVLKDQNTVRVPLVKILLLLLSVIFYYEVVTRSELIFNMMLVGLVVYICEKYLHSAKIDSTFILCALLTGVVLSTRSVTAMLFVIYFLYKFRYDLTNVFIFGIISLAVFAAFILPFYLWDPESFLKNGPFAVQSYLSNLPVIIIVLVFVAALYSGWAVSNVNEFYFSGGIILFFAAAVSFLLRVSETGFNEALINDGYDIAYFIFCVPLLILSIKKKVAI
jgi:hypothetical protein